MMEMTPQQLKLMKKDLRRRFSITGWTLLIYYCIMNVCVFFMAFFEILGSMFAALGRNDFQGASDAGNGALESAWGYFLAVLIGLFILFVWKKKAFWKDEIWAKGNPMSVGSFLGLLCIFLSGQLVYQVVMIFVELILNGMGLSVLQGMEAVSMDSSSFSMFLYGGIVAPISEELLFRGLIQRSLRPFGRRFAILASAFTFGIFHGNLLQAPYAFLVGLVLGYVASEYSIAWAMLLHMINNLVLGDLIPRLTSSMSMEVTSLVIWAVLLMAAIGAVVTLIVKRREIRSYSEESPINRTFVGCFFSSPGIVVLMVVMGLNMLTTIIYMITPL